MSRLDIHLGDGQVTLDHVQGGMAKDPLQSVDIAAIAQEVDGKSVPETVDGGVLYPCPFSKAINRLEEVIPMDWGAIDSGKSGRVDQHVRAG